MLHLEKITIGLDISDYSIEIIQVEKRGNDFFVIAKNHTTLPLGIVEKGIVKDPVELGRILKELATTAQPQAIDLHTKIAIALPDDVTYIHVFELQEIDKKQLDSALPTAIERMVPIPATDLVYAYTVLHTEKNVQKVLVVATHQQVIATWYSFFYDQLGITVDGFDINALATRRVLPVPDTTTYALVDIGAYSTQLVKVSEQELYYARTIYIGGETIKEHLMVECEIDAIQAQDILENKGLKVRNARQKKVLNDDFSDLAYSILDSLHYTKNPNQSVEKIYLAGGMATVEGLSEVLQKILEAPVEIIPFSHIKNAELLYVSAIGCAVRELTDGQFEQDPRIHPKTRNQGLHFGFLHTTKNPSELMHTEVIQQSEGITTGGSGISKGMTKEKKEVLALIGIIVLGAMLLFGAFQYRQYVEEQKVHTQQQLEKSLQDIP